MSINVTKSFLPPMDEYISRLQGIWDNSWLTNNGPLVRELEAKLKEYLGVKHVFFCGNGTIAIQIAIKVLGLTKEIITTPFSYVATTSSILWESCKPVFVDINETDFNIDPEKIEAAITPETEAIMAVHVYGNPCNVEKIEAIALKHGLKVIYDGAHCFGAALNDKQILSFGDISTCSFHATKIFHTTEGGAIITDNDLLAEKIFNFRSFGHSGDDYFSIGINGKNSEFHAAMGLVNLPYLHGIIEKRKAVAAQYDEELKATDLVYPKALTHTQSNYSYYPVVFSSEEKMLSVKKALEEKEIFTRRYFYPSLNRLPYLTGAPCPVSESISTRVLALPFYPDLPAEVITKICSIIKGGQ